MEHLSQGGMENISQIRGELSCLLRLARKAENSKRILSNIEQNDLLKSALKIIGGNLELQIGHQFTIHTLQLTCASLQFSIHSSSML